MRINSIHIKNLKSLTNLEVKFNSRKHICLLYGANGIGKTTLLEAISLLGHISSMSRLAVGNKRNKPTVRESRFRQAYRKSDPDEYEEHVRISLQHKNGDGKFTSRPWSKLRANLKKGIEHWWNNFTSTLLAGIKYEIEYDSKKLNFWICFLQEPGKSITKVLSGESNFDDIDMDGRFTLVYHEEDNDLIQEMIEHFLFMCPHQIHVSENAGPPHIVSRGTLGKYKGKSPFEDSKGLVAYWNTDLNDFGRKNDVRESVKDLATDFYDVMRYRLGLDIGKDKARDDNPEYLSRLIELNKALEKALPYRPIVNGHNPNRISISTLYSEPGDTCIKVARPEFRGQPVDFFSAGENEAFTLYMLLIWMPIKNSIILLDEPDIHVSSYYGKTPFFEELFRLAKERRCQLIISTHGGFALPEDYMASTQHIMLRRRINGSNVSYNARWTLNDKNEIASYYILTALSALQAFGVANDDIEKAIAIAEKFANVPVKQQARLQPNEKAKGKRDLGKGGKK